MHFNKNAQKCILSVHYPRLSNKKTCGYLRDSANCRCIIGLWQDSHIVIAPKLISFFLTQLYVLFYDFAVIVFLK